MIKILKVVKAIILKNEMLAYTEMANIDWEKKPNRFMRRLRVFKNRFKVCLPNPFCQCGR